MATAHLQQRPYPAYHTPQSNSPASATSSQSHLDHGRVYSQPPPAQQGMYGFSQYTHPSINHVQTAAFAPHPRQPPPQPPPQQPQEQQHHQMMNTQTLLPHQRSQATMPNQPSPAQPSGITNSPRPQPKFEPAAMPRSTDQLTVHRSPPGPLTSNQNPSAGQKANGNAAHPNQQGATAANPSAAPGPIPATTPLVVRQDGNGVQWIAFEYSRDRVKMEYTIRCDVESVNVDALSKLFKEENCVYPRACCEQGLYKGNRQQYETECNTVGWSLAQLNECLRGKRGLIQRAVDSWRNSNQDSRLRSRRVRRQNKISTRKTSVPATPSSMAGPQDLGATPGPNAMATPMQHRGPPLNGVAGPAQAHHRHAHNDGSTSGSVGDVSGMSHRP